MIVHEPLKVYYSASLKEADGRVVFEEEKPCDSLLRGWVVWQLATMQAYTPDYYTIAGALVAQGFSSAYSYNLYALDDGGTAGSGYGIQVGSSSVAVTINDYKLAGLILSGVTAGRLTYQTSAAVASAVVGNTSYYGVQRGFLNGSGAPVVVSEIGATVRENSLATKTLILRDVVGPWTVNNLATLTVTYKITTSVV